MVILSRTLKLTDMKRCICACFILFLLWGIDVSAIGGVYTYIIITPEGENKTLYLEAYNEVVVNENKYISYSGFYEGGGSLDNEVLLRQDGDKYFCYDAEHETEHLMFDFGLQKGNTFTDGFNGIVYEVIDVRDTIANDVTQKLIELQSCDGNGKRDVWMEEVGSIYTGILPANEDRSGVYLLTNSRFVYTDPDFYRITYRFYPNNQFVKTGDMNAKRLVWEKEIRTEEDWEEYLNWCNAPSDLNAEFVGDTLYIRGRLHTSCELQDLAMCILNDKHVSFKYFSAADVDCITNYEIDARIPGFQRGKYQVKLLNKTVELENTEGIYSSINKVILSSVSNNNTIYDLQGRSLNSQFIIHNSQLKKGIYIQDGKKVAF